MADQPPLFLAGATATGKSEVAMLLAEKLGGEIISVDSMQVYRGLDIGTAKPPLAEQKQIPHHLIDVVSLTEKFDAATFVRLANSAVKTIQARGKKPIFCGGTGLYFKAFLEGLGKAPPADIALRKVLESTPLPDMLDELERADPITFHKIDRQNPRRVVRAIEVIRLTGKPFSEQQADWPSGISQKETIWCLSRQREDLHKRIGLRVDHMFQLGLVSEVRNLLEADLTENPTAMQAIGYRQVVEHLQGEHSLPQTIELVKLRSRQFAKRQATWFRRQTNVRWLDCAPDTIAKKLAEQILR